MEPEKVLLYAHCTAKFNYRFTHLLTCVGVSYIL